MSTYEGFKGKTNLKYLASNVHFPVSLLYFLDTLKFLKFMKFFFPSINSDFSKHRSKWTLVFFSIDPFMFIPYFLTDIYATLYEEGIQNFVTMGLLNH